MAQAAQTNAFDANNSPIRVEHDRKRRQFVIRLNGEFNMQTLACQLMLVLAFALANVVVAPLLIPTAAISDTDGCSHIDGACLLTLPPLPVLYFSFF